MSIVLTATKPSKAPAAGQLNFVATMSVPEFIEQYGTPGEKIAVVTNPNGNAHPGNLFLSWHKGGVSFSGSVSHKLADKAAIAAAKCMISIVSTPENPTDYLVLLHAEAERNNDNIVCELG